MSVFEVRQFVSNLGAPAGTRATGERPGGVMRPVLGIPLGAVDMATVYSKKPFTPRRAADPGLYNQAAMAGMDVAEGCCTTPIQSGGWRDNNLGYPHH
jgi:hypothetical protein